MTMTGKMDANPVAGTQGANLVGKNRTRTFCM